jgi:hypothetical protein
VTTDNDRVAFLAGQELESLDPAERAELDELRALLADEALWAEPSPGLADQLVSAITAERSSDRTAPSLPPPRIAPAGGSAGGVVKAPSDLANLRARRTGRRGWMLAALGTAAALIVAVGAGIIIRGGGEDGTSVAIDLRPTELLPDASGEAQMTREASGWRIELDASGLPRRENGEFYEGWLRNADGTLVSVGTFNEGEDVVLWAGVSPAVFNTLAITQEVADGDPGSSGQRVLVGEIVLDS